MQSQQGSGLLLSMASLWGSFYSCGHSWSQETSRQNSKHGCVHGAARPTGELPFWKEVQQLWLSPPQPPAPSKPLGLEVLISMQELLVLPHHQAGPAQPSSTSHSSLGFTLTDHPKHLNLEPSLHLAHLNTVVASGRGGPPNPTSSMFQPLHKPCPLSQKLANCLNHALHKTCEIIHKLKCF